MLSLWGHIDWPISALSVHRWVKSGCWLAVGERKGRAPLGNLRVINNSSKFAVNNRNTLCELSDPCRIWLSTGIVYWLFRNCIYPAAYKLWHLFPKINDKNMTSEIPEFFRAFIEDPFTLPKYNENGKLLADQTAKCVLVFVLLQTNLYAAL